VAHCIALTQTTAAHGSPKAALFYFLCEVVLVAVGCGPVRTYRTDTGIKLQGWIGYTVPCGRDLELFSHYRVNLLL